MPIGTANSEDPLQDYSGLSLFPRTLLSLPNPPRTNDSNDLHFCHNFLKSTPIQSPHKLLEEAKDIVYSHPELMNSEMPSNKASRNEAFEPDRERERRQDLGRNKRARFSLKPNLSQPTLNLGPQPDLKKLRDPEEFFSAYEKHKNAKRELLKQTGSVLTDLDLNNISMNERPRRQGTLGRRPVKYMHHTYGHISSQENREKEILVPSVASPVKENVVPNVESKESEDSELDGSVAEAENRVNKLLDDLLAENDEQLDGDGAVTLLQDRLQIKPVHFNKLSLPDLQTIHSIDLNATREHLVRSRSSLLGYSSETHHQVASSVHNVASSLPPKSPLATLSLLRKRALQSDQLSDPFSVDMIDNPPERNAYPTKKVNEPKIVLSMSPQFVSVVAEENVGEIAALRFDAERVDCTGRSEDFTNDDPNGFNSINNLGMGESSARCKDNVGISNNVNKQDDQVGIGEEVLSMPCRLESAIAEEDTYEVSAEKIEVETVHFSGPSPNLINDDTGDIGIAVAFDQAMEGSSKVAGSVSELPQEIVPKSSSLSMNKQSSTHLRKEQKKKKPARKQSLAGFGTSVSENGLRRSTRVRSRPLEYWKGERFLYGRIHDSLATVIGIKYESPGNGQPMLRVKSFVSDEYKSLVEQAARF